MDDIMCIDYTKEGAQDISLKTFYFLIKLMGLSNQLRINHWQTKSFAEHKLTDTMICSVNGFVDIIGEIALGIHDRPNLNTVSNNVSDIAIVSTDTIISQLDSLVVEMLEEYKNSHRNKIFDIPAKRRFKSAL